MLRREVKKIPTALVKCKLPLNPEGFRFAKLLESGNVFSPIKVDLMRDGTYRLRDGRHRTLAHLLNGRTHILAQVSRSIKEFNEPTRGKEVVTDP